MKYVLPALFILTTPIAAVAQDTGTQDSVTPNAATQTTALSQEFPELTATLSDLPQKAEIVPGPELTLKQALIMADTRNLDLASIRLNLEKADAQLKLSYALILPTLNAQMQWIRADKEAKASMAPGVDIVINPQDTVKGNLTAAIQLINVSSWFNIKKAYQSQDLAELSVEQARRQLLSGVAKAFMAARLAAEVIKIQQEQLTAAKEHAETAQKRVKTGTAVKLDVLRADFNLEEAEQNVINAILSLEAARDALAVLIQSESLPMPEPVVIHRIDTENIDALVEEANQNSFEMRINHINHDIAKTDKNVAIANFLPTVNLAWQASLAITEPKGFGSKDRFTWSLVGTLAIPIFNWQTIATMRLKNLQFEEIEHKKRKIEISNAESVRKLTRDYRKALLAVDSARRKTELAVEAERLAAAAYANGATTMLDVSEAQRNVSSAKIALATALMQADMSLVDLHAALGRELTDISE